MLRSSNIDEDTFALNDEDVFVDEDAVSIRPVREGEILITAANGSPPDLLENGLSYEV